MDSVRHISRAASRFFSGTVLSRFTGMWREMVMAAAFGSQPAVAAFMIAYRFANLLRRLFGEGAMNAAFVPQFEELRMASPERAGLFFRGLQLALSLFLILVVVIAEIGLWSCLQWMTMEEGDAEVVRLTALMLPAIVAICLFGLNSALLNCERIYFLPSVAPALFNIAWIAGLAWLWGKDAHEAMFLLSLVVVLAFAVQWFMTMPKVLRLLQTQFQKTAGSLWSQRRQWLQDLRRLAKPLFLGILGVGATQINSAIDPLFARAADPEGPAFLWYAIRIQQLPLSLFGIALTGALLPPLSRAIKSKDIAQYRNFLQFAVTRSFGLIIPCTLAIMAMGLPAVNLLYGRGAFDAHATLATTQCLWGYGLALLPSTFALIFSSAFYAQENYRVPALSSTYAVVVNVALNAIAVFILDQGAASVAVATSASAWFQCFYLAHHLKRLDRGVAWREAWPSFGRISLATLIAAFCTSLFGLLAFQDQGILSLWTSAGDALGLSRQLLTQLTVCSAEGLCFGAVLFLMARLLKAEDLLSLIPSRKLG